MTGKFAPSAGAQAFKLYDAVDIDTAVTAISANATATLAQNVLLASGTFTILLYNATAFTGNILQIKNTGTGTVTVSGASSQTIDGSTSLDMQGQNAAMTIISDGSNWRIV